jgi:hypothetical protein
MWPLKTNKEIDGTLGEGRKNGVRSRKRSKSRSRKRFSFPLLYILIGRKEYILIGRQ